ncbi:MAG: hypothetical protein HUT38_04420 [Candidatus Paceibacter sp.]|nr:hypothetical protein [Candidatus Paceibacter sp.]
MLITGDTLLSRFRERESRRESIRQKLTWETIVAIDPFFDDLLHEIEGIKPGERFCANDTWYKKYKPIILNRVGWYAPNYVPEILKIERAYDLVYQRLYDALPDCKGCGCFTGF